jgi:predicted HD superfamily hydrolase involved in NAD metabolism
VLLAKRYKVDEAKARLAGLIHDCAKNLKDEEILDLVREEGLEISEVCFKSPQIMHGLAGAIVAKNTFKVIDDEILNAITYHTTGRENMTALEKIIFLADFIEPNRDFFGVETLRVLAFKDLEKALVLAFDNTINFVIMKGELIHLDTVIARNDIILKNNF